MHCRIGRFSREKECESTEDSLSTPNDDSDKRCDRFKDGALGAGDASQQMTCATSDKESLAIALLRKDMFIPDEKKIGRSVMIKQADVNARSLTWQAKQGQQFK